MWQVANEVYLQCVPEKQENLLRARTLMRGSSLARFLALCEGCDIEWKGDGSNTLQMFVEDREHMKEVRYAHRRDPVPVHCCTAWLREPVTESPALESLPIPVGTRGSVV